MTASSASYALTLARRSTVLPLSAFASARHYADGGGIPIIAHPGELILNEMQQGNIAAAIRAASSVVNNKSSATSNDNRGAGIPQITFNNYAPGVSVTPERMSDGEIIFAIHSVIAENNKRLPSVLADSERRRA